MAPDVYKPVYSKIKDAYVKKKASAKVVTDFEEDNRSSVAGITAYKTAYKDLWDLQDVKKDE